MIVALIVNYRRDVSKVGITVYEVIVRDKISWTSRKVKYKWRIGNADSKLIVFIWEPSCLKLWVNSVALRLIIVAIFDILWLEIVQDFKSLSFFRNLVVFVIVSTPFFSCRQVQDNNICITEIQYNVGVTTVKTDIFIIWMEFYGFVKIFNS